MSVNCDNRQKEVKNMYEEEEHIDAIPKKHRTEDDGIAYYLNTLHKMIRKLEMKVLDLENELEIIKDMQLKALLKNN